MNIYFKEMINSDHARNVLTIFFIFFVSYNQTYPTPAKMSEKRMVVYRQKQVYSPEVDLWRGIRLQGRKWWI